jgi:hypothetical protein
MKWVMRVFQSSERQPGSYERLGIVEINSDNNSFYLERVYKIIAEHFENACNITVMIV